MVGLFRINDVVSSLHSSDLRFPSDRLLRQRPAILDAVLEMREPLRWSTWWPLSLFSCRPPLLFPRPESSTSWPAHSFAASHRRVRRFYQYYDWSVFEGQYRSWNVPLQSVNTPGVLVLAGEYHHILRFVIGTRVRFSWISHFSCCSLGEMWDPPMPNSFSFPCRLDLCCTPLEGPPSGTRRIMGISCS